ncbi:MAG: hypothetical protein V7638_1948 [Acidobacteriota bacterium]|jgi:hypothetical protein
MFPFTETGPFDRTEKKALLVAASFCAVFVILLSVSVPAKRVHKKPLTLVSMPPVTRQFDPPRPSHVDPLDSFRLIPANFTGVDFQNFSYGVYDSPELKRLTLTLTDGKMWDDSGWFNLQDVYYKDLTGDRSPEAIVRLLHLRCHGSCDGGSDVFYIYSRRNGKLKNIWRYETGSYAYGCGLKSLMVGDTVMIMDLFGRCSTEAMFSPGPAKYLVEDLTSTVFEFDGRQFTTKSKKYISDGMRNVKNWEPQIWIY